MTDRPIPNIQQAIEALSHWRPMDEGVARHTQTVRHFLESIAETDPVGFALAWPKNVAEGTINTATVFQTREKAQAYIDLCNEHPEKVRAVIVPVYARSALNQGQGQ